MCGGVRGEGDEQKVFSFHGPFPTEIGWWIWSLKEAYDQFQLLPLFQSFEREDLVPNFCFCLNSSHHD